MEGVRELTTYFIEAIYTYGGEKHKVMVINKCSNTGILPVNEQNKHKTIYDIHNETCKTSISKVNSSHDTSMKTDQPYY